MSADAYDIQEEIRYDVCGVQYPWLSSTNYVMIGGNVRPMLPENYEPHKLENGIAIKAWKDGHDIH